MMLFGFVILTVLAVAMLLAPFVLSGAMQTKQRNTRNVDLYKQRLDELNAQRQAASLDDATYAELKADLDAQLEEDYQASTQAAAQTNTSRVAVAVMVLFIVVGTAITYTQIGSYQEVKLSDTYQTLLNSKSPDRPEKLRLFLLELDEQAEQTSDPSMWLYILARGYTDFENYTAAVDAYKRLATYVQEDAAVWAGYGQALFLANKRTLTGEAELYLKKALSIQPFNGTALGVLGINAFEQKNYAQAVSYWQQALKAMNPNSSQAQMLQRGITQAQQALGQPTAEQQVADKTASNTPSITVNVRLGDINLPANAPVFILTKALNGMPMPLAVEKLKVSDLPVTVVLDDSKAMQPQLRMSLFNEVEVIARVTLSGGPGVKTGDYQAVMSPVKLQGESVEVDLVIKDQVK